MKYIIRLLAAVPMLGAGVAAIVFGVMAFDNAMWILATICNIYSFLVCAIHYEDTVRSLAIFIKLMAEDTLHE